MNFIKFKNKTYKNFFLSHLILLVIPVLIITLIISKSVFNVLEEEIEMRDKAALTYSSYLLNDNLSSSIKISETLATDDNITPFKFGTNITESISVISKLNKYVATNNIFDKIFIHFFEDNYIYSNTSSYTFDRFIDEFGSSNENFNIKLSDTLKNIKTPTLLRDADSDSFYILIPYISNTSVVGSMLFSLNIKTLDSIINSSGSSKIPLLITKDNKIINLSKENLDSKAENSILALIEEANKSLVNDSTFSKTTKEYSIFLTKLPSLDLYFLSITDSSTLFSKLTNITNILIITILLTLIFGSIAVFIFTKINYKPIKHLKEVSKKLYIERVDPSSYNDFNEFDMIENTINSLQERNSELEYEFSKNIPMIKNAKLNELINGTISNKDNFLKEAEALNIDFSSKYHGIVLIKNTEKSNLKIHSLKETISKFNIQNFSFNYEIPINTFINEITVFLIGLNTKDISIENNISLDENILLALGSIQDDISLIAKSYVDARRNLEVSSNKLPSQSSRDFLSKYDPSLKVINDFILMGDIENAYATIYEVLLELRNESLPFKLVRSIYFEIIIMYNNYMDKEKGVFKSKNIDLSTLYQINSLEELNDVFKEISCELLDLVKKNRTIEQPKLSIEKIKNFVLSNYTDYSFSLQLVADNFNISLSYLSQYFKDKTSITILEYITELKINRAKDLLINTNSPLKDISEELGYSNVSSFIRRFKQVTSMTPGEFKRVNIKEDKQ